MKGSSKSQYSDASHKFMAEDYRILFESAQDALILYSPDLQRFTLCNQSSCRLFGYLNSDEIYSLTPTDISAEYQPDGRLSSQLIEGFAERLAGKKNLEGRWLFKRKDGKEFLAKVNLLHLEIRKMPMILGNIKDITEEARIEEELRDSAFSLDAAVNGTGMGLWDWDIENNNLILNDNWFDMLGFVRKDFEKRYDSFGYNTFADYVHPDDLIKVQKELEKHYAHEIDYYRVEIRMKTADNDWRWVLAAGKVCEWSGDKPRRMVGIHTDIDYRIKMEDRLKEAIHRAEESDRLKTAFLANMSHEIRTPMNGIIGFMDLMVSPETTDNQRNEYADIIRNSSRQLLNIVNDIMDMSKIEAGQVEIVESVINIENLVEEVSAQFSNSLHKGVKFLIDDNDSVIYENIMADQSKLYQVFSNLISNAAKFTHRGKISVGYRLEDDMLQFYVKDTGEGIDPDNQELIFERFHQIDIHPSRQIGGTGLGLSICKAYIEKMGGNIWLESSKGKGSTFYFTIPYKPVEYTKSRAADIAAEAGGGKDGGVILVVEDELYNYLFAEYILKDKGYQVIHSENGKKAVEYIRLYPEISLVIMDIRLPDITGYDATRQIKQIRPELPVVALTALALSGDRESALEAGCDDYLKKPITKEKLLESVTHFLEM